MTRTFVNLQMTLYPLDHCVNDIRSNKYINYYIALDTCKMNVFWLTRFSILHCNTAKRPYRKTYACGRWISIYPQLFIVPQSLNIKWLPHSFYTLKVICTSILVFIYILCYTFHETILGLFWIAIYPQLFIVPH